jgi:hypothetical protein
MDWKKKHELYNRLKKQRFYGIPTQSQPKPAYFICFNETKFFFCLFLYNDKIFKIILKHKINGFLVGVIIGSGISM